MVRRKVVGVNAEHQEGSSVPPINALEYDVQVQLVQLVRASEAKCVSSDHGPVGAHVRVQASACWGHGKTAVLHCTRAVKSSVQLPRGHTATRNPTWRQHTSLDLKALPVRRSAPARASPDHGRLLGIPRQTGVIALTSVAPSTHIWCVQQLKHKAAAHRLLRCCPGCHFLTRRGSLPAAVQHIHHYTLRYTARTPPSSCPLRQLHKS